MKQKILFQGIDGQTKEAYLKSPFSWYQRLWNQLLRLVGIKRDVVWCTATFDETTTYPSGDELKVTYTLTSDDSQPVPMEACDAFNAVLEDEDDDGVAI